MHLEPEHYIAKRAVTSQGDVTNGAGVESAAMQRSSILARVLLAILSCSTSLAQSSTAPKAVKTTEPEYTQDAREHHVEGAVLVTAIIGVDGKTHGVEVQKGLGHGLDKKAVEAVQQWRFEPATKNGQRVMTRVVLEVAFHLP